MRERKLVYVPMAVDTVHPGHLNIIKVASELGQVMVGLFTDEAIASYKRVPVMNYEQRKAVIENIKGVDLVVKQESRDYEPNLRTYRPDYMVHGTDWREGPLAEVRARAMEVLAEWGGEIVEPEYTKGVSSSALLQGAKKDGVTSEQKRVQLKRLLNVKGFSRIMGVYSGRTAQIGERAQIQGRDGVKCQFDALWLDVEGMALQKGVDRSQMSESELFQAVWEINLNSEKPLILPFRGGNRELFLRKAEQAGAAGIAVWDEDRRDQRETIGWLINHRNYQDLMIMAVGEEPSDEMDSLGAEGYIFRRQKGYRGSLPALVLNDTGETREVCEGISGMIYGNHLGRMADARTQEAAEMLLKIEG